MSSVLLGSSTPEQLIENLGAIQASATALSDKLQGSHGVGEDVPRQCPLSPHLCPSRHSFPVTWKSLTGYLFLDWGVWGDKDTRGERSVIDMNPGVSSSVNNVLRPHFSGRLVSVRQGIPRSKPCHTWVPRPGHKSSLITCLKCNSPRTCPHLFFLHIYCQPSVPSPHSVLCSRSHLSPCDDVV